jgi:hypothetical protein
VNPAVHPQKTCETPSQCQPCSVAACPQSGATGCNLACTQCTICGVLCNRGCTQCTICGAACRANCTQCTICGAACRANCTQCTICNAACRANCTQCTVCNAACRANCVPCTVAACPQSGANGCNSTCTPCTGGCGAACILGCECTDDFCPVCDAPIEDCPSNDQTGICCPVCESPSCPVCPDCNRRRAVNPGDCLCTCDDDRPEHINPVDPTRPPGQPNTIRNANCSFAGCNRTNVDTCPSCGYCRQCEWQYFGIIHCISCRWGGDCLASEGVAIDWCSQHNRCNGCCGCGASANIVPPTLATTTRVCVYCTSRTQCSICPVPVCGECNWIRFGIVTCQGCRRDGDCISGIGGSWTAGSARCGFC